MAFCFHTLDRRIIAAWIGRIVPLLTGAAVRAASIDRVACLAIAWCRIWVCRIVITVLHNGFGVHASTVLVASCRWTLDIAAAIARWCVIVAVAGIVSATYECMLVLSYIKLLRTCELGRECAIAYVPCLTEHSEWLHDPKCYHAETEHDSIGMQHVPDHNCTRSFKLSTRVRLVRSLRTPV